MTSLRETFQEYFKLRLTTAAAGRLSEGTRSKAIALLLLGRQKSTAAEQLWGGGHRAEGLRMASDAFALLLDCARAASTASAASTATKPAVTATTKREVTDDASSTTEQTDDASASEASTDEATSGDEATTPSTDDNASTAAVTVSWSDALQAIGTSSTSIKQVQTAVDEAAKTSLPTLEGDVLAAHETLFTALREATTVLETALDHLTRTPAQLRTLSRVRQMAWGAAAALLFAALVYVVFPRNTLTASASAYLVESGGYPPSNAVDGDATTEWLTPNGATGWLEVAAPRPRALNAIRILNARTAPYFDRGMRDFHVEAFAGNTSVGTARGNFATVARGNAGEWQRIPMRAAGVTRVRIFCDNFHGQSCGIAEIQLE